MLSNELKNIPISLVLTDAIITLAWGYLSFRFWRYFKRIKGKISEFFFYFALSYAISFLFFTLSDLLVSKWILIIGLFFVALACACLGYLIIYIQFPKISPRFGFWVIFLLGMVAVSLNIFFPPIYSTSLAGALYLSLHPLVGILIFITIVSSSLSLGIIIIRKALSTPSSEGKTKSLGLGILCLSGIVVALFYSLFPLTMMMLFIAITWAIGIILLAILTQKLPPT